MKKTIIGLCLILIGTIAIWYGISNTNSASQAAETQAAAVESPVQEISPMQATPAAEPKNEGYVVSGTARSKMVAVGSTARPAVVPEATVRESMVRK